MQKNKALEDMLASAIRIKEKEKEQARAKDKELVSSLPVLKETKTESQTLTLLPSLSLEPEKPISRQDILGNLSVGERHFKASVEEVNKAKRKVGRLTTGASAAIPLVCRGAGCPFSERCVSGDTLVMTPKGLIPIDEITVGSVLYSFDSDFYLEKDIVTKVIVTEERAVFEITTNSGFSLKITEDHPILVVCPKTNTPTYKSLKTGLGLLNTVLVVDEHEHLLDSYSHGDLFEDIILSIEYAGVETVYDISVAHNNTFIANGIASHNCPYFQLEPEAVIGEDCLKEVQLVEYWTGKYLDELQIDTGSISEMHSVSRLVEITIMDLRMTDYMAINDQNLMMEYITSVSPEGSVISNLGPSVAFDIKERLERQKLKILETLNNTREKKAKLVIDTTKVQATASNREILAKLDRLASIKTYNSKDTEIAEVIDYDI